MKERIKMDLTGKDEVFLTRIRWYRKALFSLEIFKKAPENLSEECIDGAIDCYQMHFEGGKNFDRNEIALRVKARAKVVDLFTRAIHFLHCIATEDDIPKIREVGLEVTVPYKKKARKTTVAVAVQGND